MSQRFRWHKRRHDIAGYSFFMPSQQTESNARSCLTKRIENNRKMPLCCAGSANKFAQLIFSSGGFKETVEPCIDGHPTPFSAGVETSIDPDSATIAGPSFPAIDRLDTKCPKSSDERITVVTYNCAPPPLLFHVPQ